MHRFVKGYVRAGGNVYPHKSAKDHGGRFDTIAAGKHRGKSGAPKRPLRARHGRCYRFAGFCGRQIPCAGSFFAAFVCVCFTAARRAACGCLCSAGRQELHACGIHGKHRCARCVRFIQRPREPHQKRRGEIRFEHHSRRRARCRDRCV